MAGRAFRVKVQLDVHAVTCPGVWLCPNGKVALRISTLDFSAQSHGVRPIFPLLFHEHVTFDKIFARISLKELQSALEREFLYAELIQWVSPASRGIVLATFETNLADLLYPTPCCKGLLAGVDVDLLMEPSKCFPGIIAPKIEVSTKTIVEEILGFYDTSMSKRYVIDPKMISSKQTTYGRRRSIKGITRQRRVCHAKSKPRSQSCQPYRQNSNDPHRCPSYITNNQTGSRIDQCYHSIRRNSICTCRSNFSKLAEPTGIRDDTHVTDNCPVCFKYNCYFPKCHDSYTGQNVDSEQRYCRNVSNVRDCRNGVFDTQKEAAMPLLQSKIKNLQKIKEKCATGMTDNIVECDPRYEYIRDYSPGRGFYKNLEKFYKRMYKQAKIRAQETDV